MVEAIQVIKAIWVPHGRPSPQSLSFEDAGRIIQKIKVKT